MQETDKSDLNNKGREIVFSLMDDDEKIQAMKETDGLSSFYKELIISSLMDDDKKIQALQEIDGLSSLHKTKIIRFLTDDNKKNTSNARNRWFKFI